LIIYHSWIAKGETQVIQVRHGWCRWDAGETRVRHRWYTGDAGEMRQVRCRWHTGVGFNASPTFSSHQCTGWDHEVMSDWHLRPNIWS